jgi:hypothetical protein
LVGSIAAGAQSGIGSVVAPSLFATLQSAAAGGYGVAVVAPIIQGVGGVLASFVGATSLFKKSNEQETEGTAVDKDQAQTPASRDHEEEEGSEQDEDNAGANSKL